MSCFYLFTQTHYGSRAVFGCLFHARSHLHPNAQKRVMSNTQAPLTDHPINKMLPVETFMLIFEEHAKVDWRAPSIDGRVCRLWRQIVLNTPQAWSYIEIGEECQPSIVDLRTWLRRSATAPLHIRIFNSKFDEHMKTGLNDLLCEYHTRIASLRMRKGNLSLFEGRDFLSLQHLDIENWSGNRSLTGRWGLMPQLRSLRLSDTDMAVQPLDGGFSLERLVLFHTNCTLLPQHSQSLTTLMLSYISLEDIVLDPLLFPSLTYLSLHNVTGLKPHVDAPRLVTYLEGGTTLAESIPTTLQSTTEYGWYRRGTNTPDFSTWLPALPNVSRLSVRAYSTIIVKLLAFLDSHLHVLPGLQMICVRAIESGPPERAERRMLKSVQFRNGTCRTDIPLYFERAPPYRIPILLGHVSH